MFRLMLGIIAAPLVVLAVRDIWRGMSADDADQFKATVYVQARSAAGAFAVTAPLLATTSAPVAVAFLILAVVFQFAVSDRLLASNPRTPRR